jgi:hypothetical protein
VHGQSDGHARRSVNTPPLNGNSIKKLIVIHFNAPPVKIDGG